MYGWPNASVSSRNPPALCALSLIGMVTPFERITQQAFEPATCFSKVLPAMSQMFGTSITSVSGIGFSRPDAVKFTHARQVFTAVETASAIAPPIFCAQYHTTKSRVSTTTRLVPDEASSMRSDAGTVEKSRSGPEGSKWTRPASSSAVMGKLVTTMLAFVAPETKL